MEAKDEHKIIYGGRNSGKQHARNIEIKDKIRDIKERLSHLDTRSKEFKELLSEAHELKKSIK